MKLITKAEYARYRGVSKAAVTKAAQAGRITLIDGKVDVDAADQQWADRTNAKQTRDRPKPIAMEAPGDPAARDRKTPPTEKPEGEPSLPEAQRLLELEKLRKLRAENDRIEGKTLDAEDVRKTWERHRESVKNRLLLTASKVPPVCREVVDKEIRAALEELGITEVA